MRNDVEDTLAMVNFTVLPSLEEAAGLALLESFAADRPVIASRVGGIPEFIRDGTNGILVEPGDVAGLAAAMARLCTNAGWLTLLSAGATPKCGTLRYKPGRRGDHGRLFWQREGKMNVEMIHSLQGLIAVRAASGRRYGRNWGSPLLIQVGFG